MSCRRPRVLRKFTIIYEVVKENAKKKGICKLKQMISIGKEKIDNCYSTPHTSVIDDELFLELDKLEIKFTLHDTDN